ncbi:13259_t:CDS:2, partial [Dentiscutata heterogama]
LQANINNMIAQMTRTNTDTNATAPCRSATPAPTSKYTPAPILDDLIMKASKVLLQGQNRTTSSTSKKFIGFLTLKQQKRRVFEF